MQAIHGTTLASALLLACTFGFPNALGAQTGIGTWVKKVDSGETGGSMTMTVEACCRGGRKLTYQLNMNGTNAVLTVESPFDGTEVPVLLNGKPSGETMAIKLLDDHHTTTVLKMNGQPFGISKATLSADGRMLTVVNDVSASGGPQPKGLQTEIWIKK
jgi:hypothetical protein